MHELCQQLDQVPASWIVILGTCLWPLLSAVVNAALRFRTPQEWADYAAKNPRGAAVIRMFSAAGIDPAKFLLHLQAFLKQKANASKKSPEK